VDPILDPVIVWTARLVLAAVLLGAAVAKLRALEEFAGVVHNYRLLPEFLTRPLAYALPVLELVLALGLLLDATRRPAAGATAVVLAVFACAMAINLWRGRVHIDCGCFASALKQRLSWALVARNGVLIGLALLILPQAPAARALGALDLLTVAVASGALLLLYAAFSQLAGLEAPDHRLRAAPAPAGGQR
jgi:uncharacterized membrane protein YphA (DoxX/SURF4 family)